MPNWKKLLTDALAAAMVIIMTVIVVGLFIVGLFYLHSFVLEVVSENCYTNMFGELICKVK